MKLMNNRMIPACLILFLLTMGLSPIQASPIQAINSGSLAPLGPAIEMTSYSDWPSDLSENYSLFGGGTFDGQYIWMIPLETNQVVRLDPLTGQMTGYKNWPAGFVKGGGAFSEGVYAKGSIWLIPALADRVIKLDPATGHMTGYNDWPAGTAVAAPSFSDGVFDGTYIWLIPVNADSVVRLDPITGEMVGFNNWPSGFTKGNYAFSGGVYDGTNIWLIPSTADRVIKLNPNTGEMIGYDNWPSGHTHTGYKFKGGIYDGQHVWMTPYSANGFIKLDTVTGEMTGYNDWPSGFDKSRNTFGGSAFDGKYIWTKPDSNASLIRVDTATGEITENSDWPSGYNAANKSFTDAVYDGLNVWLIPGSTDRVIRLSSVPALSSVIPGDEAVKLGWEPVHGAVQFKIFKSSTSSATGTEVAAVSGSTTEYTVTGLTNGETYYFTIKAVFQGRESAASNEVSATPKSGNANLNNLLLTGGILHPTFSSAVTTYTAAVANHVDNVTLSPTLSEGHASLKVNGTAVASGSASGAIPLNVGNNIIEVVVTAQDGTTKTYTVTVTRAASSSGNNGVIVIPPKLFIDKNGTKIDPDTVDITSRYASFEIEPNGVYQAYVSFPAKVLKGWADKNPKLNIEVSTEYGGFYVPVHVEKIIPELSELLAKHRLSLEDAGFKLILTDQSNDKRWPKIIADNFPNGEQIGAIVDFRMEIINNRTGQTVETVNTFSEKIAKTIAMPMDILNKMATFGAFSYEESGKLGFAPATIRVYKDQALVSIYSYNTSSYVVLNNPVSFTDVRNHWAERYIGGAASKALMAGVGNGKFKPDQSLTRAEFAAMLVRVLNRGVAVSESLPYSDMDRNAWYFDEVATAKQLGLLGYVTGSEFFPDQPLTREEMANTLAAAARLEKIQIVTGTTVLNDYKDKDEITLAWLADVQMMVKSKIMTGTSELTFNPKGESTRAQAAAVLLRLLEELN
ncbi:S-layer homology domain-containing protein [Paenibacillus sp. GCM10027627]|uniref:S-layer homology domain-containing protein n=1 Tax=unclassified Paenibacillus TaxID=185978 RepID=UPI003643CA38